MNTSDSGVSDGAVGVDSVWKRKLGKLLAEAPLADSLLEALWPLADLLHGEGMEDLIGIIEDKSAEWCDLIYSPGGGFNLPRTYRLDFAIAIYLYTLARPSLYSVINKVMFNPARRTPGAAGAAGVSDDLRACMPYIKFLDAALEALPPAYVFRGELRRGVRWVYPSPDNHDPKRHFAVGGTIMWYEFKSTSKKQEVLTRPHFCGVEPGPRTIFTVEACRGYDIEKFSFFQGVDSEFEVLFRPLSKFKVSHAAKNIINPKDTSSLERSGFPDAVALQQVDDAQEQPQPAPTPAPASWSVHYSAEHKKAFFCNDTSGETTWDAPSAVLAQRASQLVQAEAAKAKQEEEDRKLAMQLQQVQVQLQQKERLVAEAEAKAKADAEAKAKADAEAEKEFVDAAGLGDVAKMKLAQQAGASVHSRKNNHSYKYTALHMAAARGHTQVVQLLLQGDFGARPDVNARNAQGSTPLMRASQNHHAVVVLLLQHGARINDQDNNGWTPLMEAARYGQKEIAQMLIGQGANIGMKNKAGQTAEAVAQAKGQSELIPICRPA